MYRLRHDSVSQTNILSPFHSKIDNNKFVTGKDVVLWNYIQLILGIAHASFSILEATVALRRVDGACRH